MQKNRCMRCAIRLIKALYYWYIESLEWTKIGNIPEVLAADKLLYNFIKQSIDSSRFDEAEDAIAELVDCVEMQGFIYGFDCAMEIIHSSTETNL